jgi:hypothetical protein
MNRSSWAFKLGERGEGVRAPCQRLSGWMGNCTEFGVQVQEDVAFAGRSTSEPFSCRSVQTRAEESRTAQPHRYQTVPGTHLATGRQRGRRYQTVSRRGFSPQLSPCPTVTKRFRESAFSLRSSSSPTVIKQSRRLLSASDRRPTTPLPIGFADRHSASFRASNAPLPNG